MLSLLSGLELKVSSRLLLRAESKELARLLGESLKKTDRGHRLSFVKTAPSNNRYSPQVEIAAYSGRFTPVKTDLVYFLRQGVSADGIIAFWLNNNQNFSGYCCLNHDANEAFISALPSAGYQRIETGEKVSYKKEIGRG